MITAPQLPPPSPPPQPQKPKERRVRNREVDVGGMKRLRCDFCDQTFKPLPRQRSYYQVHLKRFHPEHYIPRKFVASKKKDGGYESSGTPEQQDIKLVQQTSDNKVVCDHCGKEFGGPRQDWDLSSHIQTYHDKNYQDGEDDLEAVNAASALVSQQPDIDGSQVQEDQEEDEPPKYILRF